ncbi:lipid-A-disaccharide synthase [Amaricoccus solimangrovi]|uniref:Lipid-A-disaccharide synthase n=1 Tax=Amaricoccus solimangrovi TaxID=2589815 RepID=A0A501WZS5_9RHOB|nr:lipid-A-disaccharide synthase [Amaricoccus solimangrovi]TPE53935.1 lipid-A-disaccharide synthase [Amaricoccus solimangrovi]
MIAGEPSGDLLGAALLRGLRELGRAPSRLKGIGGPAMAAEGLVSLFPMSDLSVMGVAEVLPRLPGLLAHIRETAEAVIAFRPDALVTIDSPDFALRVARKAKAALPDLKVIHYVAPSVWAWRPGRAAKMARSVDHVLALLPFEPPYMEAAGMSCDFVGHPVAAQPVASAAEQAAFRAGLGIGPEQPLLLLLPGSRRGEVTRLAPVFAEVGRRLRAEDPDLALVVPSLPSVADLVGALMPADAAGWPRIIGTEPLPRAEAEARQRAAFASADAALAASGTVSLELAAAGTPMVIAYAMNPLSAWLARRLVRVSSATLVNIVTESRAIPEFLFEDCTAERITPAVAALLGDRAAGAAQIAAEAEAMALLGRGGEAPGLRAARSVLRVIG